MSTLKLTYFDFDGGRGEPPRLALAIGGIAFEDDRVSFEQWKTLKPQMPFEAIPVLDVDGKRLSQCNAINRYVGKLAGLYPEAPWQVALCDEAMDAVEDIGQKISATFRITDEEQKKTTRQALANGPIPVYLRGLETCLRDHGGQFFADSRLTVADLKVFVWIRHLRSGNLDHVPADLVDKVAPLLVQHFEAVRSLPKIVAYYKSR